MANQVPQNSVWSAMEYQPPRGRCNYKTGILSSCPCLRFMLHPVRAATSFDCDGCSHHASFHSLENEQEDAILKKWSGLEAGSNNNNDLTLTQTIGGPSKKRRRIADKPAIGAFEVLELSDDEYIPSVVASSTRRTQKQTRKTGQTTQCAQSGSK